MPRFQVQQVAVGGFDHNFSYVIYAAENGDAAVVDPCGDIERIRAALAALPPYRSRYILITHGHHDHISGLNDLGAFFPASVAAHPRTGCAKDIPLSDRQRLPFGSGFIEVLFSPGHSTDSVIYRLSDDSGIFTGDTLFVDWIGYGEAKTMYHTLQTVVLPLSDHNLVYSGHDYGREPVSPLGVEKQRNPYLSAPDFTAFRAALKNL